MTPEVTVKSPADERLDELLKKHDRRGESLLAILQDIQSAFNYVSEEHLPAVAAWIDVPLARVYAVATFYNAFSLDPKGKYVIKVCMGTACHVRGAPGIVEEVEMLLGIRRGETTADGKFTLETVNCIGACALGPVMVTNGDYQGHLSRDKIQAIIGQYK